MRSTACTVEQTNSGGGACRNQALRGKPRQEQPPPSPQKICTAPCNTRGTRVSPLPSTQVRMSV
eukprot:scaffold35121_cov21-Tisochrysis_lutea.AAC.1